MRTLCAEMVLEVVRGHLRPREHVQHGQVLWMAVGLHDPPHRHQRIADTQLVPVILDLSNADDIEARLDRRGVDHRRLQKILRLCRQAYDQGGLLSNCDLAELLDTSDSTIAHILTQHERTTQSVVPRRATVHDVGTGTTHKRIILHKRYAEGKETHQIARETYHSTEAVDRYLAQYHRVRCCRLKGFSPEETTQVLECSLGLVSQYLAIDDELETPNDT